MLEIPQRTATPDLRDGCEVVRRRRRSGGPLERPCIPGIASGNCTPQVRPQQVANENKHTRGLKKHSYGYNEIPNIPATPRLVGINSARHPKNAGNMHEIESQMESNDEE